MKWQGRRGSANVRDRRGAGGAIAGGGVGAIVIALIVMLMGGDPGAVLQQAGPAAGGAPPTAEEDSLAAMVSVVLADTEEVWTQLFREEVGSAYRPTTLELFTGGVDSGCGFAQAAMGPFYCPLDQSVYIDLSFYRQLREQFGAPGDFAQAYVVAHEVGHHVQTLLGISDEVRSRGQRLSRAEVNALSVRQELQADCFAGVWANRAQQMWGILEPGDVEEALRAASAIGDDRLQQQAQGEVVPESFTHGTAAQRSRWFGEGLRAGSMRACDTFSADRL